MDRNVSTMTLQHLDAVYSYAMSLTRNEADANDLVQEAYLRTLRAIERLRPDSNLKGWLFAIVRNARINQIRQRQSRTMIEMDEQIHHASNSEAVAKDPHALYVGNEEQAALREAVESLPSKYREVILLREFEGFSYQQIAEILNRPAGTVMSRLFRARNELKAALELWKDASYR